MELPALILSSNEGDPFPVLMPEDLQSDSATIKECQSSDPTSPLEHIPPYHGIPWSDTMRYHSARNAFIAEAALGSQA